jgi:hypothetical protein
MAEVTLKPGEKAKIGSLEMELSDITKKRLPINPETGEGRDEEVHLRLVLKEGGETSEVVLEYRGPTLKTESRGHKIVLLEVENFQEWARFRVEKL